MFSIDYETLQKIKPIGARDLGAWALLVGGAALNHPLVDSIASQLIGGGPVASKLSVLAASIAATTIGG